VRSGAEGKGRDGVPAQNMVNAKVVGTSLGTRWAGREGVDGQQDASTPAFPRVRFSGHDAHGSNVLLAGSGRRPARVLGDAWKGGREV
jgi:hypothetical protein